VRPAVVAPVALIALIAPAACGDGSAPGDSAAVPTSSLAPPSTPERDASATTAAPTTRAAPSTAPATTTATDRPNAVVEQIDLGGEEALGLAVDADAVYAVSFQAGTVSRIDPSTSTVTHSVQPGAGAATAMAADGAVWVASYGGRSTLSRLRPDDLSEEVTGSPGELCCDLTIGDGAVWAVDPGGAVLRIDPASATVVQTYPVTLDANAHTNAVYGTDALWVSSDTTDLMRLDPSTGEVTTVDVGGGVPFVARDGLVWGATPDRVWAVDAATGELREEIELEGSTEVLSLEVDGNDVWVGIRRGSAGRVLLVDRATGAVVMELDDVDIPARMVLGFGSLWVTDSGSSDVVRVTR